ncbi:MAG TPA: SDR family oxidoreductase [Chloroflexota bacterium]|nr:SDR family oxidoreductase [Chloroflexota bacterium]
MPLPIELDLQGRVAVITGGARGMGAAYVRGFLEEGARVVAADRSWTGVEGFQQELEARGVLCLDMDVTDDAQLDRAYQATLDRFGTVDALVNNAAMRSRDLFPPHGRRLTLETSDEDFLRMYSVNVFGALKVIRRFVRPMLEKQRGSIVNVVSSGSLFHAQGGAYAALRPDSVEQPYMSSKAALANLSFYLAAELKDAGVAVNAVVPGHTRTTGFDEQNRARLAEGRRPGPLPYVPEHVVPLVLFLASQDARGVTGRMFDAVQWNREHGLGDDRWRDTAFSYDALLPG